MSLLWSYGWANHHCARRHRITLKVQYLQHVTVGRWRDAGTVQSGTFQSDAALRRALREEARVAADETSLAPPSPRAQGGHPRP